MAPRAWISGSMQLCPVLIIVISCHHQVSYTDIKGWREIQNITRSLWWVALHFLIFQLSVNESWGTGFLEMSLCFRRNYSSYTTLQRSGNYCCCLLSQQILIYPSSFHSWTSQLTGNWNIEWNTWWLHFFIMSEILWAFLIKKSAFAC